jgi:hypothetical protein
MESVRWFYRTLAVEVYIFLHLPLSFLVVFLFPLTRCATNFSVRFSFLKNRDGERDVYGDEKRRR